MAQVSILRVRKKVSVCLLIQKMHKSTLKGRVDLCDG